MIVFTVLTYCQVDRQEFTTGLDLWNPFEFLRNNAEDHTNNTDNIHEYQK